MPDHLTSVKLWGTFSDMAEHDTIWLSYSNCKLAKSNPMRFALAKMVDPPLWQTWSNAAVRCGTAFDELLKRQLCGTFGQRYDPDSCKNPYADKVPPTEDEQEHAERLIKLYTQSRSWHNLCYLLDRCNTLTINDQRIKRIVDGIPMEGTPDINGEIPESIVVIDAKVMGQYAKNPAKPKKGHVGSKDYGLIPFEQVDREWATQLTHYGLLLGTPVDGKPPLIGIEQVAGTKDDPIFVSYRGRVSPQFQRNVWYEAQQLHRKIQNRTLLSQKDYERLEDPSYLSLLRGSF